MEIRNKKRFIAPCNMAGTGPEGLVVSGEGGEDIPVTLPLWTEKSARKLLLLGGGGAAGSGGGEEGAV